MLTREERILSELLLSRGLVSKERLEECARRRDSLDSHGSLVEVLIDSGEIERSDGEQTAEEARALEAMLDPDLPGAGQLGEFRLIREIGRGGMGIVYEAEQESLGRRVALKILPAGAALDERLSIRFLKEARAAARLNHPGIVPIYTSGRAQGVLYFAMEMIEGRSLAEVAAAGPLEPLRAARLAAEVARALDHAHRTGLVHRDVKPENILLDAADRALITDFGLVHEATAGPFTLPHHVLGTPAFISPEQALGKMVDPRSDVYSLGAVLYTLLAGKAPFDGEVPSVVLGRVLAGGPAPLDGRLPGLPADLITICERAMAREPDARYPSALAMAEDLERYMRGEALAASHAPERSTQAETGPAPADAALSSAARPEPHRVVGRGATPAPSPISSENPEFLDTPLGSKGPVPPGLSLGGLQQRIPPDLAHRARFRRAALGIAAVALVALLVGGGLALVGGLQPSAPLPPIAGRPRTLASFQLLPSPAGRKATPTLSPDGTQLVYASDADGDNDLYLQRLGQEGVVNLTADSPMSDSHPAFSPDGARIAFVSSRTHVESIYLLDLATLQVEPLTAFGDYPSWSADGRDVVFNGSPPSVGAANKLWAVEVATGRTRLLKSIDALTPACSPHGRRIAFVSQSGGGVDIWTISYDGGEAIRVTDDPGLDWSPVWSPGGDYLYFGSDRGGSFNLWRVRMDETSGHTIGDPEPLSTTAFAAPFSLTASAKQGTLALASQDQYGRMHSLRCASGASGALGTPIALARRYAYVASPDLSPDLKHLAYTAVVSSEDLAVTSVEPGSQPHLLTEDSFREGSPRWSPDGSRIAFQSDRSGTMQIWTMKEDGADLRQITHSTGAAASAPVWSADGGRIAYTVKGEGTFLARLDRRDPEIEALPRVPSLQAKESVPAEPRPEGLRVPPTFEAWSWSPDGTSIAGTSGGIVLYSVEDRRYRRLTHTGERPVWLGDSRHLLYTNGRDLHRLDTRGGEAEVLFSAAPSGLAPGLAVSPDGQSLYLCLTASSEELWSVQVSP